MNPHITMMIAAEILARAWVGRREGATIIVRTGCGEAMLYLRLLPTPGTSERPLAWERL